MAVTNGGMELIGKMFDFSPALYKNPQAITQSVTAYPNETLSTQSGDRTWAESQIASAHIGEGLSQLADKWIGDLFGTDGGLRPMSGIDNGIVG